MQDTKSVYKTLVNENCLPDNFYETSSEDYVNFTDFLMVFVPAVFNELSPFIEHHQAVGWVRLYAWESPDFFLITMLQKRY